MKKAIILISILAVIGASIVAKDYYWGQVATKGIASTLTDTIGPFSSEGFSEGQLWSSLDLQSSTTITMTVTPMAKHKDGALKDIDAAVTVASAITADDDDIITQLMGNDSAAAKLNIKAPLFWLKRITTVTGDSVTVRQAVFCK